MDVAAVVQMARLDVVQADQGAGQVGHLVVRKMVSVRREAMVNVVGEAAEMIVRTMPHVMTKAHVMTKKVRANPKWASVLHRPFRTKRIESLASVHFSRAANFCRSLATLGEITAWQYDCCGCNAK